MYNIPNFVIIQWSWDILIKVEVANNGPENNDAFIRCDVGLCRSNPSTLDLLVLKLHLHRGWGGLVD